MQTFHRVIVATLLLSGFSLNLTSHAQNSPDVQPLSAPTNQVYIIPVKGTIDLGLAGFINRAIDEAEETRAKAIILEINTFGGRIDAAIQIRDRLFETDIKTIAFINKRAISAGALISLATEEIIMSPGSTIGAAKPVVLAPGGMQQQPTGEKEISYVRAEFKATAEAKGHPEKIAQAMVDPDIELKSATVKGNLIILTLEEVEKRKKEIDKGSLETIIAKEKLLTLSSKDALKFKLVKYELRSLKEVMAACNLETASLKRVSPTWSEGLVRLITHPLLSGLLLVFGMLGIVFELKIPGWGVSGTIGIICLALFFGGHYLIGLANWIEILLFVLGLALLSIEIFITPGFGVLGISGIIFIILSIFLTLVKHPIPKTPFDTGEHLRAFYTIIISFLAAFVLSAITFRFLPKTPLWGKFVLLSSEKRDNGFVGASEEPAKLVGKQGFTRTALRPAGKAVFNEKLFDVVTEGDFIPKQSEVRVIRVEGNRIVVVSLEKKQPSRG